MAHYVSLVGEWYEVNSDGVPLTDAGKKSFEDNWAVVMGRVFTNQELADTSIFDTTKPRAIRLAVSDFVKDTFLSDKDTTKNNRIVKIKDIVKDVGLGKK